MPTRDYRGKSASRVSPHSSRFTRPRSARMPDFGVSRRSSKQISRYASRRSPARTRARIETHTDAISPLRHRMIEDMAARKLGPHSHRRHIDSCKRFAHSWGARPARQRPTTCAASSCT
jgi:hypothetical protein